MVFHYLSIFQETSNVEDEEKSKGTLRASDMVSYMGLREAALGAINNIINMLLD